MTTIANKVGVAVAGCAIAAAASLTSVAPAQAAPTTVPVPAAPAALGPGGAPELPWFGHWKGWDRGSSDMLRGNKPFLGFLFKWINHPGCYHGWK